MTAGGQGGGGESAGLPSDGQRQHRLRANGARPYDTVVIGTGIGGLTAAAILARSGRKVIAVERHDRVGGYAHSFRRGPYLFDAAVHLVGGCEDGGLIDRMLTATGVRDRCRFELVDPCYRVELPGFQLAAPVGLEPFAETYQRAFPEDAKGIRSFLGECKTIRSETRRLMEGDPASADPLTLVPYPALQRHRRATVAEVLDAHVASPRARAALTALWPYVGLPPDRLSFLYWASMLLSYVEDGAYYCKGTFQVFADALADVVRESGGTVLLRSAVRNIETDSSGATGVVLRDGTRIAAETVVSNADLRQTVDELVGGDRFPRRYRQSLSRMQPSVSALVAYLAVDRSGEEIASAHETFSYGDWDHSRSYQSTLDGAPSWFTLTVPTKIDPDLAPAGKSLLVYTTLVPYDAVADWRSRKPFYRDRILRILEQRSPGIGRRIEAMEVGTPQTMIRYTANSSGALYGWELSPHQIGPGRPPATSPIPGLYLAGHWTQPGGGIYGVVTSGVLAARAILGCESDERLWRSLTAG